MGYRNFTDRDGKAWEIREYSASEWFFEPTGSNRGERITVRAPGYEKDAFELSNEELQKLLDDVEQARSRPAKSPFID